MGERVVFLLMLFVGAVPTWIGGVFAYGLAQMLSDSAQRREFFSKRWDAAAAIGFTAAFLLAGGFLLISAFTWEPANG